MIVQPKVRGFICTTAHPEGCARHVGEWINYAKQEPSLTGGPQKVLIIGASTGFGLASRIVAAFGAGAKTSVFSLKGRLVENAPLLPAGTTPPLLRRPLLPPASMPKALMVMLFRMKSNNKPSI